MKGQVGNLTLALELFKKKINYLNSYEIVEEQKKCWKNIVVGFFLKTGVFVSA